MREFDDCTDEELIAHWNYLETIKLSSYIEAKMDAVYQELTYRGVISWNVKGEITERQTIW